MSTRVARFGIFMALALILSYVESLIPFYFGMPGVKLGITNIVILFVLYTSGMKEALLLSVSRVILAGLLFGSIYSIIYSFAGGILSLGGMYFLKRSHKFTVSGVSIAGGVLHNAGQLLVAMVIVETYYIAYYIPVLLISGLVTGYLIGIISSEILKRITSVNYK